MFGEEKFGMKSVYGLDCTMTRQIPMAIIKGGKPAFLGIIEWPEGVYGQRLDVRSYRRPASAAIREFAR